MLFVPLTCGTVLLVLKIYSPGYFYTANGKVQTVHLGFGVSGAKKLFSFYVGSMSPLNLERHDVLAATKDREQHLLCAYALLTIASKEEIAP